MRLETEGEGTEVDKTVIERLSDPITHMLRNAIDHGLEAPDERAAAGKPKEGVIRLRALHRSGRIVIEVEDDGRGINRERVFSIAVTKGFDPSGLGLDRRRDRQSDFSAGILHGDDGVGYFRSRRRHGCGQAQRAGFGRTHRHHIAARARLDLYHELAADACGARRHGDRGRRSNHEGRRLARSWKACSLSPNNCTSSARAALCSIRDQYVPLIDIGQVLGYRNEPASPLKSVVLLVECEDGSRAALVADAIHRPASSRHQKS